MFRCHRLLTIRFVLEVILGFWGIFAIGFALRGWIPSIDKRSKLLTYLMRVLARRLKLDLTTGKHELQGFSRAELMAIADNINVPHVGVQRKTLIGNIVDEVPVASSPCNDVVPGDLS